MCFGDIHINNYKKIIQIQITIQMVIWWHSYKELQKIFMEEIYKSGKLILYFLIFNKS